MEFTRTAVTVAGNRPVRLSVIDIRPPTPRGTIVMLHGAGGNAEQWKHQIQHFAPHYRVIAPDLRGHGASEAPRSAYSLEEFLWDFAQILEQLQVPEQFILMAHSFGGPVALTFSAAHQRRVARLVLVATAPEMHLNRAVEMALKLPIPIEQLERLRPMLFPKLHAPLFVLKKVLASTLFPWRGWDLLPNVAAPTLIVGGQFDLIVPSSTLESMRQMMPAARLELVRYTGHLPHLERPNSVNTHIEAFLEERRRRSWRGEEEHP
ncbi:MAG: alpha/beta fold hydrolase [Roseiflexaceae bacterium]